MAWYLSPYKSSIPEHVLQISTTKKEVSIIIL